MSELKNTEQDLLIAVALPQKTKEWSMTSVYSVNTKLQRVKEGDLIDQFGKSHGIFGKVVSNHRETIVFVVQLKREREGGERPMLLAYVPLPDRKRDHVGQHLFLGHGGFLKSYDAVSHIEDTRYRFHPCI